MARVTLEDLIERKVKLDHQSRTMEITSEVLGGSFMAERMPLKKVLRLLDGEDTDDAAGDYDLNLQLIYESCPIFRRPELLERYKEDEEIAEPHEVVGLIFDENVMELARIAQEIMAFYGMEDIGGMIKN